MLPKTGKKFPGGNDRNGSGGTYAEIVADALVTELGATHRAAKILMGWTGAGERTVKHWLAGTHGPAGGYLIVLMRESESVFRTVVEAAGRSGMGMAPRGPQAPDRTRETAALPRMEQAAGPSVGHRTAGPGSSDRDSDRIHDRDDGRDHAGAMVPPGGSGTQRQTWFLEALAKGSHVSAAGIMERWRVSEKTARRDIAALTASGMIEFVGTRRSGRYRLSLG